MKIFKVFYYLLITVISIVALLLLVSIFPIPGNFKVLTVLSGSMEPAIHRGSVVIVFPTNEYKIGEIITFGQISKTKTPTTHRIFDMKVDAGVPSYITKGDANNGPDQKIVTPKEIIGKVLFSVPFAGYVVTAARKPWGFIAIIIIPALIIIYDEIKKIIVELRKGKQQKASSQESAGKKD
jgi:signal peptidase